MLRVGKWNAFLAPYALAVVATAVCALLAWGLSAAVPLRLPGQFYGPLLFLPVIVSARYGGWRSALLTAILCDLSLDYLFEPPLLRGSFGWPDLFRSTIFVMAAGMIVALNKRWQRAEEHLHVTRTELLVAREIQQKLFPSSPPVLECLEVAGTCCPATATSGDYFDYVPMRGGALGVVIGDISGHGLGPAILMAETRAALRVLALSYDDPGEILTKANRLLVEDTCSDRFSTLFFARLDADGRSLTYAAAGHEGYLFSPDGRMQRLSSTAPPLGIELDLRVPCGSALALEPGQVLLLFTDGLSELGAASGSVFGNAQAFQVVRDNLGESAQCIHDRLQVAAHTFAAGREAQDDITIVVLRVMTKPAERLTLPEPAKNNIGGSAPRSAELSPIPSAGGKTAHDFIPLSHPEPR